MLHTSISRFTISTRPCSCSTSCAAPSVLRQRLLLIRHDDCLISVSLKELAELSRRIPPGADVLYSLCATSRTNGDWRANLTADITPWNSETGQRATAAVASLFIVKSIFSANSIDNRPWITQGSRGARVKQPPSKRERNRGGVRPSADWAVLSRAILVSIGMRRPVHYLMSLD